MTKELFEAHVDFCRTFSNAKRLEMLELLKSGEMSVTELQNKMGITKANASQQLTLMRMKRIVKARREGQTFITASPMGKSPRHAGSCRKHSRRRWAKNRPESSKTGGGCHDQGGEEYLDHVLS